MQDGMLKIENSCPLLIQLCFSFQIKIDNLNEKLIEKYNLTARMA